MRYLANNYDEANNILLELSKCKNCIHFTSTDLFNTRCQRLNRFVDHESMCECFETHNKTINYRINKAVKMCGDYSGMNDFFREWDFHEQNGTEDEFLKIRKLLKPLDV